MDNFVPEKTYHRKGPDIISRIVDIGSVILWGFLILNVAIILMARPEQETFFDRLFNISVRDYWDAALLQLALFLSLAQLVISIISLYLNCKRLKRKGDRLRISIILSIFIALIICLLLTVFLLFS